MKSPTEWLGTAIAALATGVVSWSTSRRTMKQAEPKARAEGDQIVVATAKDLIEAQQRVVENIRADNVRLGAEIEELHATVNALQSLIDDLRSQARANSSARDAELLRLREQIRQQGEHMSTLERAIKSLGGTIPERPF